MSLNREIIILLKQEGCCIVGFADLRCLSNEIRQNFDYGILIALSYTKDAMQIITMDYRIDIMKNSPQ